MLLTQNNPIQLKLVGAAAVAQLVKCPGLRSLKSGATKLM